MKILELADFFDECPQKNLLASMIKSNGKRTHNLIIKNKSMNDK